MLYQVLSKLTGVSARVFNLQAGDEDRALVPTIFKVCTTTRNARRFNNNNNNCTMQKIFLRALFQKAFHYLKV